MSIIDRPTTSTGISRRTALRGAAWTATAATVVVATPNIAAASGGLSCTITGTRNGANFSAAISCGTSAITSVQIGTTPATLSGSAYQAKLSGNSLDTQMVTVNTAAGSFQKSVNFA